MNEEKYNEAMSSKLDKICRRLIEKLVDSIDQVTGEIGALENLIDELVDGVQEEAKGLTEEELSLTEKRLIPEEVDGELEDIENDTGGALEGLYEQYIYRNNAICHYLHLFDYLKSIKNSDERANLIGWIEDGVIKKKRLFVTSLSNYLNSFFEHRSNVQFQRYKTPHRGESSKYDSFINAHIAEAINITELENVEQKSSDEKIEFLEWLEEAIKNNLSNQTAKHLINDNYILKWIDEKIGVIDHESSPKRQHFVPKQSRGVNYSQMLKKLTADNGRFVVSTTKLAQLKILFMGEPTNKITWTGSPLEFFCFINLVLERCQYKSQKWKIALSHFSVAKPTGEEVTPENIKSEGRNMPKFDNEIKNKLHDISNCLPLK